jgi:hypothetical protein
MELPAVIVREIRTRLSRLQEDLLGITIHQETKRVIPIDSRMRRRLYGGNLHFESPRLVIEYSMPKSELMRGDGGLQIAKPVLLDEAQIERRREERVLCCLLPQRPFQCTGFSWIGILHHEIEIDVRKKFGLRLPGQDDSLGTRETSPQDHGLKPSAE